MAKQKKGATVTPKVLEAQHKKEIIKRFKAFITDQSSTEVAALFTPRDYDILYLLKTGGLRVVAHPSALFRKDELQEIKDRLVDALSGQTQELFPNKPPISDYCLLTLGMPFLEYLLYIQEYPVEKTAPLAVAFGHKARINELYHKKLHSLYEASFLVGLLYSSYEKGFCYIYPVLDSVKDKSMMMVHFVAHRHHTEKRTFKIDGHNREALRVAFFHTDEPRKMLEYYDISPAELCISHPQPTKRLKVYIQRHALLRMFERIDSIQSSGLLESIFDSIQEPITTEVRPGKLLVEYRWFGIKLGYFLATVEGDALLIRTFLFITSNGTPEGDLLKSLTGLQVLDKKFLAIDRLSTFVAKEVVENPEIREIFDKVGCSYLFNEILQYFSDYEFLDKHTPAVKLPTYITGNAPQERWMENEETPINDTLQSQNMEKASFIQRLEQAWMKILKHLNTLKGRKSVNGKIPKTPTPSDAVGLIEVCEKDNSFV